MTPHPTEPPAITTIQSLVLVRLLPADVTGLTARMLQKDLFVLVKKRWEESAWRARCELECLDLLEDGLIQSLAKGRSRKLALTLRGRRAALVYLQVDALPDKLTWAKLRDTYLVARALGVELRGGEERLKISKIATVKAAVLQQAHELPICELPAMKQAEDALLWQQLGRSTDKPFSLKVVKEYLLNQLVGGPRPQSASQVVQQIVAGLTGASNNTPGELRLALIRRRIVGEDGEGAQPQDGTAPRGRAEPGAERGGGGGGAVAAVDIERRAEPFQVTTASLELFARQILEAARACSSGRFGSNKVFISHVLRRYTEIHPAAALEGEADLKERLVAAHQRGLLKLSRADLVEAMNPTDVAQSEIRHLNASFHFVRIEEA